MNRRIQPCFDLDQTGDVTTYLRRSGACVLEASAGPCLSLSSSYIWVLSAKPQPPQARETSPAGSAGKGALCRGWKPVRLSLEDGWARHRVVMVTCNYQNHCSGWRPLLWGWVGCGGGSFSC